MFTKKFSIKDKIFFLKELAYLLKGGLSIPVALDTIKTSTENEIVAYVCETIYSLIKKGETLSRSLSVLDDYFNEGDVKIVSAGEGIGELPRVLKQVADEYENLYMIKMKYITAMIYPSILIIIIIITLFVIFKMILPGFIDTISGFPDIEMPATTQVLIDINNFLQENGFTLLLWFTVFVILLGLFASTQEGRKTLISVLMKTPLIGKIYKLYSIVYFLRYFTLLIYSGLPIIKVFLHIKGVVTNPYYKDMCDDILDNLNKGESFVPVMKSYSDIIPSDVTVLLKVGEETASLEEAAKNAISLYEEEFNKIIDNLSKIIEPILILFIGGLVGFVAISIFSIVTTVLDGVQV